MWSRSHCTSWKCLFCFVIAGYCTSFVNLCRLGRECFHGLISIFFFLRFVNLAMKLMRCLTCVRLRTYCRPIWRLLMMVKGEKLLRHYLFWLQNLKFEKISFHLFSFLAIWRSILDFDYVSLLLQQILRMNFCLGLFFMNLVYLPWIY